jgi:two-component system OmpR family response regulator
MVSHEYRRSISANFKMFLKYFKIVYNSKEKSKSRKQINSQFTMKVLIIEDNEEISSFLKIGLQYENFLVDVAHDGVVGLEKAFTNAYDLYIIDLLLPHKDGREFLQAVRKKGDQTPAIFLTALTDHETKVSILNSGADDYLQKPFSFNELLARIKAVLRRTKPVGDKQPLLVGDLLIHPMSREVKRGNKLIHLRKKEFDLLYFMATHQGQVLNPSQILEQVWDYSSFVTTNTVGAHISNLRRKIDQSSSNKLIHTVHGVGYKFG